MLPYLFLLFVFDLPAKEKINLRFNLNKGELYKITQSFDQEITHLFDGQNETIKQKSQFTFQLKVLEKDAKGLCDMEATFLRIYIFKKEDDKLNEFESTQPIDSLNLMHKVMSGLVNQSYRFKMDPYGKVSDFRGLDQIIDRIFQQVGNRLTGEQYEALKKSIKSQFGEESLTDNLSRAFGLYPTKPVDVGDSWHKEQEINYGMQMKTSHTWTLTSRKKGIAEIEVNSKIQTHKDKIAFEVAGYQFKYDLKGTQTGKIEMKEANGWINTYTLLQEMSGNMLMNRVDSDEISVPIKIKSIQTFKTLE